MLEPQRGYWRSVLGSETVQEPQSVRDPARTRLLAGGVDGNEWLTTATGIVLLVLLAVLGLTILQIRQLIWLHLFLGLLLMGPVTLKMASTGWRFVRYYVHSPRYMERGPPLLPLRLIAPVVVLTTALVFASGIVLLALGPRDRGPWVSVHKVSFILWIGITALHVLGHLPRVGGLLGIGPDAEVRDLASGDGAAGRWIALIGAVVAGAVLAVVLIPHFGIWTAPGAFPHHHDG
jgi:hypothetical protein